MDPGFADETSLPVTGRYDTNGMEWSRFAGKLNFAETESNIPLSIINSQSTRSAHAALRLLINGTPRC